MTLFSIILSSLKPSEEIWRRRKLKWGEKVRIMLYRWTLRRGLIAYRRSAVYDSISLDGGRINVIHEYRDHAFEKELKTAKVISQLSFKTSSFPFKVPAKKRNFRHRWFDFTDVLKVEVDGRELKVEHGELYAASAKGRMSVKRTRDDDYIMAALYIMAGSQSSKKAPGKISAPAVSPAPSPVRRLTGESGRFAGKGMFGNTVGSGLNLPQPEASTPAPEFMSQPVPEVTSQPVTEQKPQSGLVSVQVLEPEHVAVISKRGLDIDTSF